MPGRSVIAAAVLAAVAAPWAVAGAQARQDRTTFTRSPSHGKPGTVIEVAGTGCEYGGKPYQRAVVRLYYRSDPEFSPERAEETYSIDADGSFEGTLTVPHTAPPGRYLLSAECYADDMVLGVGDEDFTVDGVVSTPTRTPTPPPSSRPPATPTATRPPSRTTTPPTPSRSVTPSPSASASATRTRSPSPSPAATGRPTTSGPVAYEGQPNNGRTFPVGLALVLVLANAAGVATAAQRSRM